MSMRDWIQIGLYFALLLGLTPLLGAYMAGVLTGRHTAATRWLVPLEELLYQGIGVHPQEEMTGTAYTGAVLWFSGICLGGLWILQLVQTWLPLNPQRLPNVGLWLAFNTAVSFMTNTNWQSYAGETTLSYLTQMVGLTVQNFVSAAVGIAVLLALTRGLAARGGARLGNFWVDLVRSILYILLPLSLALALVLVAEGVVQTLAPALSVTTLQGQNQVLPLGPAASQIAIKQLGTNGGGFFNANSAHPFENPTPLTNFLEMLAILLLPAALTHTFGRLIGAPRQGWAILAAMLALLLAGLGVALWSEYGPNTGLGATPSLEGKEVRVGQVNSVLWAELTTAASNGSVNAMLSSMSPLTELVAIVNILLGEVIFGGVGAGLYGMLLFVLLTVFIAGLMVGRTPEYLGKKIEAAEIKMAMIAVLAPSACVLLFGAAASILPAGLDSRLNTGPHGLTEMLYAFASAAGNNGSALAGLNANTDFYNITLGISMLIGRFAVILPVLAIAESMSRKRVTPPSPGTFPTDGPLFVGLLAAVVVIVGALTFFPALSLGPLMEHLMQVGRGF